MPIDYARALWHNSLSIPKEDAMSKTIRNTGDTYRPSMSGDYRSIWGSGRTLKDDWAGGPKARWCGSGYQVQSGRSSALCPSAGRAYRQMYRRSPMSDLAPIRFPKNDGLDLVGYAAFWLASALTMVIGMAAYVSWQIAILACKGTWAVLTIVARKIRSAIKRRRGR